MFLLVCKNSLSSSSFIYLKPKNSSDCCLRRRWQFLCNRFSRFLLDLDGWGCHLDSISSTEISHWPLWAAFGAYCQVWRKEWGCSDLHLPFRGRKGCCEEICVTCWPIHPRGTTGVPHFSIRLVVGIKKNILFAPYSWSKPGWALLLS